MKKSVLSIVLMVFFVAVGVTAYSKWGNYEYDNSDFDQSRVYSSYYAPYYELPYYAPYFDYPAYEANVGYYPPAYLTPYYPRYYFNPLGNYRNSYLSPLSSKYMFNYGLPQTEYAALAQNLPGNGAVGELCGSIRGQIQGCETNLVCDYTQINVSGVGLCARQSPIY